MVLQISKQPSSLNTGRFHSLYAAFYIRQLTKSVAVFLFKYDFLYDNP
ncbi:hypothetical protein Q7C_1039 [Methylophaga frappieri]|uniref:Uncharacterized protein n=1 Tax=Methylophaga frappieri (strain ATCC BAA-2434 / DSM 25690 / JAM7) TaxID=754477 RepID=I1YH05_METFJ|nr:hypothetical protein Q7C_1039 [Methylophaga frappieri]